MVYRGTFQVKQTAALSRAINAYHLLWEGKREAALALAREAVAVDPEEIMSLTALGDSAAALGRKDEARKAWQSALDRPANWSQTRRKAMSRTWRGSSGGFDPSSRWNGVNPGGRSGPLEQSVLGLSEKKCSGTAR